MTTTDPRKWLTDAKKRADRATEGPWHLEEPDFPRSTQVHPPRGARVTGPVAVSHSPASDAEFIAAARTQHPAMAAALTAVLDIHRSNDAGVCRVCAEVDDSAYALTWPCPTVVAITDNLEITP